MIGFNIKKNKMLLTKFKMAEKYSTMIFYKTLLFIYVCWKQPLFGK